MHFWKKWIENLTASKVLDDKCEPIWLHLASICMVPKWLHFYLIFLVGKKKESYIGSRRHFIPLYFFVFERHSFTHRHSWHYGKDHYVCILHIDTHGIMAKTTIYMYIMRRFFIYLARNMCWKFESWIL